MQEAHPKPLFEDLWRSGIGESESHTPFSRSHKSAGFWVMHREQGHRHRRGGGDINLIVPILGTQVHRHPDRSRPVRAGPWAEPTAWRLGINNARLVVGTSIGGAHVAWPASVTDKFGVMKDLGTPQQGSLGQQCGECREYAARIRPWASATSSRVAAPRAGISSSVWLPRIVGCESCTPQRTPVRKEDLRQRVNFRVFRLPLMKNLAI